MRFDIFESVKAKGQLCSNELLLAKTFSKELIPLWNKIADCQDKEEMQRLKKKLPGVTWQAHFPSGHRVNAEAEPSGLYMVDIDGVDLPSRVYNEKVAGLLDECAIMAVHITPSRKGLRIVAMCRPELETIEQNQEWLAGKLGVEIDAACKDLARFSYLVPDSYFLYFDHSIWTREPEKKAIPSEKTETLREPVATTPPPTLPEQDLYRGLRLEDIALKWLELNGGLPQPGERNTVLFELATRMRYITEFKPEAIVQVIPHCGLSKEEVLALCKSACSTQRCTKMPSDLRMVIRMLSSATEPSSEEQEEEDEWEDGDDEDFLLRMPRLPLGLKESLDNVPDKMKMPVLCGIMPLAMSYATDTKVKYCDGKEQRLNLMTIVWGRQASGKSSVKEIVDIWKRPMKEADAVNREEEDEYKRLRKSRKANEKLPEEPHKPILEVPITISCSTLLKRMKNACGKHLFSFGEELDTLRKSNGAGSWSSKYDVYRLGFDNGEWGQDFNSDQAESGVVDVAYNWTVLGTRGAVEKCFKGENVENGMSGRILFARMPSNRFEHMPNYGDKTDVEEERILQAVHVLSNASGFIDTPKLRKAIETWCNQKADEARQAKDDVLDTFRKRAAVIGFRCGVIFQLLECEGDVLRESKGSLEFAVLLAEYALKYQTMLFGPQLQEVNTTISDEGHIGKNKCLFDELPTEFTFEMLQKAKPEAKYTALRTMVYKWKRNGLITTLSTNRWTKAKSRNES